MLKVVQYFCVTFLMYVSSKNYYVWIYMRRIICRTWYFLLNCNYLRFLNKILTLTLTLRLDHLYLHNWRLILLTRRFLFFWKNFRTNLWTFKRFFNDKHPVAYKTSKFYKDSVGPLIHAGQKVYTFYYKFCILKKNQINLRTFKQISYKSSLSYIKTYERY